MNEGVLEKLKNRTLAFSSAGDVRADTTEDPCALDGTKSATDFLLHLDHADVLFGPIIGERDRRVDEKAEDGFPVKFESVQQIDDFWFGRLSSSLSQPDCRSERVFGIAASEDLLVLAEPTFDCPAVWVSATV